MSRCEKKEERQELKLGYAVEASPLSSTNIGMFSDSFRSCDMCNLGASFAFSFHFSFMYGEPLCNKVGA